MCPCCFVCCLLTYFLPKVYPFDRITTIITSLLMLQQFLLDFSDLHLLQITNAHDRFCPNFDFN
jgi:hypothetical protein